MLYSSGTTGRPKGIKPPLRSPGLWASRPRSRSLLGGLYGFSERTVYLSPGPALPRRAGRLDDDDPAPRRHRGGHGALRPGRVPPARRAPPHHPHAVRPHAPRADPQAARRGTRGASTCRASRSSCTPPRPARPTSSGRRSTGSARRCTSTTRAARAAGSAPSGPQEWLEHPGSVGRSLMGAVHIVDDDGNELGRRRRRPGLVRERHHVRVPRRPGEDGVGVERPGLEHARRRRPRRRRRLPLPHRPGREHDHLRWREHLPPRDRGRAHRAPGGGRRRRHRRARRRHGRARSSPSCSPPTRPRRTTISPPS